MDTLSSSFFSQCSLYDTNSIVQEIHEIASLDAKACSSRLLTIKGLIQALLSKLDKSELTAVPDRAKRLISDLKIIKLRLDACSTMRDEGCIENLNTLITALKGSTLQKKLLLKTDVPASVLTIIGVDRSLVQGFWQAKHIAITQNNELVFSQALMDRLDDALFEVILKCSSTLPDKIFIDLSKCPLLGVKAPALLRQYCPDASKKCFQCINTCGTRFWDHTLVIGDKRISVNKGFLAVASPFFKVLFESQMRNGNTEDETILREMEPQMVRRCIKALLSCFDMHSVTDINELLSCFHLAEQLALKDVAKDCADSLKTTLSHLLSAEEPLREFNEVVGQLQPYFLRPRAAQCFVYLQCQLATYIWRALGVGNSESLSDLLEAISKNHPQLPTKYPHLLPFILSWSTPDELLCANPEDLVSAIERSATLSPKEREEAIKLFTKISCMLSKTDEGGYLFDLFFVNFLRSGSSQERAQAKSILLDQISRPGRKRTKVNELTIIYASLLLRNEHNPKAAFDMISYHIRTRNEQIPQAAPTYTDECGYKQGSNFLKFTHALLLTQLIPFCRDEAINMLHSLEKDLQHSVTLNPIQRSIFSSFPFLYLLMGHLLAYRLKEHDNLDTSPLRAYFQSEECKETLGWLEREFGSVGKHCIYFDMYQAVVAVQNQLTHSAPGAGKSPNETL